MINREKLKEVLFEAEKGDTKSIAIVREVLRPLKKDSIEEILEKITIFTRLIFLDSMKYKDAPFHKKIDRFYAEQIHSLLNTGKPKKKGLILIGFRESAKTTRVKFLETYLTLYLGDIIDYTNIVSENGSFSSQFNMDMFNTLAFSKVNKYFPDTIPQTLQKKKESQTMRKFTTKTGVTYSSRAARQSDRGGVKMDIKDDGEIETKRPKKVIFDDIENENTISSRAITDHISSTMSATIDGLDQILGFWILIGNYLSLRGNVAKFINKYSEDEKVETIMIPIDDDMGSPTWEDKYCQTDKEEQEFYKKGIIKRSIESIRRESENFEVEYRNNPKRSYVYFEDKAISGFSENDLIGEEGRKDGYLEIEAPSQTDVYIIGADSARGVGKDESAFVVLKTSGIRYEEVANYKSKTIKPEDFASVLVNTARKYNNALIIPENNYPGNETIAFIRQKYQNIYKELDDYGVNTNLKTKPEMFLNAKKIFIDRLLEVRSNSLYSQILEYPHREIQETKRDETGGHFDLLMSLVIALYKAQSQKEEHNEEIDKLINKTVESIFGEDTRSL